MNKKSVFKTEAAREQFRSYYYDVLSSFPFTQQYVETSFGQTFVLSSGTAGKPPVVLLHGSCSNSVFMAPEMLALSSEYCVYAVDIVGEAGNSSDIRPDLNTDDFALWLREVLDTLGIQSVILIGNSLGGWLALKFTTQYLQRVSHLILISPGGLSSQNQEFTDKAAAAALRNEPLMINSVVTSAAALRKEVEDFMNLILRSYDPITETLPVYSDAQLKQLAMPVLFIGGEQDIMLDAPGAARRLEKILPHAEVHLLKDTGHMIFNAPEFILPFLKKGNVT
jgi:pimeloyl-ACP methyl ester carboxylesterase